MIHKPLTHSEAKARVAKYTEPEIVALAERGHADPNSLSADEAMAVLAYVWLRLTARMG
jgi:hypothetical protein